jgi:hypothetical protein
MIINLVARCAFVLTEGFTRLRIGGVNGPKLARVSSTWSCLGWICCR